MKLTNKQRQAINLAAAKLMGLNIYHSVNEWQEIKHKVWLFGAEGMRLLYDITQNPQQMNEFIEHPDVMMHVDPNYVDGWDGFISLTDSLSSNPDRSTAIIKCAAKRLGVKL